MSVRADAETFRSIPIFADCEPVHLQLLAFSAVRQGFDAGDVILKQGLRGGSAYLILSGRADIYSADDKVGSAGPGAMVGEVAMIGDLPYAVSVRASESLAAARIDRALFMRVAAEYPEFGAAVFAALARKLEGAMADLEPIQGMLARGKSFRDL
ncbi:MAG: cyclic nucleotide-binding domain-containing protein [Alphaproteobacteria bacterium]|nr:cyclic nucleotide-binding domain-containing protein [Alphaproteobacteria bacterium]